MPSLSLTLLLLLISFSVAMAAVGGTRRLALRYHVGALPSTRKIHTEFKPLLGGLGIFVGLVIGILTATLLQVFPLAFWGERLFFWGGLLVIILTGAIDDIRGISAWQKFMGEFLAAGLLVMDGCYVGAFFSPGGTVFGLGWMAIPFSLMWIVFIMNAINLLDGLDGLSSGIALIITTGFLLLAIMDGNVFLIVLALSMIGGILGFLRFNYHPASIFMGDVGSLMLGYLLAAFSFESLKIAGSHQVYFLASLVMLGMPVTDTLISFFRRMGRGDHPFKPDREHIHHRLLNLGLSHLDSVWLMYYFTLFYVSTGVLMVTYREFAGVPLFFLALIFSIYWTWRLGYVETRRYLFSNDVGDAPHYPKRRPLIYVERIWHQIAIFFGDVISINLAMYLIYWFRFQSGVVNPLTLRSLQDYLVAPVWLLFTGAWVLLFWLNGLYQMHWDISRFSKAIRVSKVVSFGILLLLLLLNFDIIMTGIDRSMFNSGQLITLGVYWIALVFFVNTGRLLIIGLEKRLHIFEYTFKNTLIIGATRKARNIIRDINGNPHLLNRVVGIVDRKAKSDMFEGLPLIREFQSLPELIHNHRVEEIIVAVNESSRQDLLNIIAICDRMQVVVKTLPELQAAVSGHTPGIGDGMIVRAFPENMLLWQWAIKRFLDIVISAVALLLLLLPGLAIALTIYMKYRRFPIGKLTILGVNSRVYSMLLFHIDRENLLQKGYAGVDLNTAGFGKWLYHSQLYKLPQLLNVLAGHMSLVGPRPEPPGWYHQHQGRISLLHRRLMVRPGITGLAQMKYRFESSQKDLQQRIKYDIFYRENISLKLDAQILLRSFMILLEKLTG